MKVKYLISICAAVAILGCGSGSYKASENLVGDFKENKDKNETINPNPQDKDKNETTNPNPKDKILTKLNFQNTNSLSNINQDISWTAYDDDEANIDSTSSDKYVLAYSKWHNALRVIDTNVSPYTKTFDAKFLYVNGKRKAIDSNTNASEQRMSKVIESDGNIYAVQAKAGDNFGNVLGVYKIPLGENFEYSNIKQGSNFYPNENIKDIATNSSLLVVLSANELLTFDKNNLANPKKQINFPYAYKVVAYNNYIIATNNKLGKQAIFLYDNELNLLDTLELNKLLNSSEKSLNVSDMQVKNNILVFSIKNKNFEDKIYTFDIKDKIYPKNEITTSSKIRKLAISNDGLKIATQNQDKKAEVFNIKNLTKAQEVISAFAKNIFIQNDNLILHLDKKISVYKINE